MDLRKSFWSILNEMSLKDDRIILLTGDLGYPFFKEYKGKMINCGAIEQSMIGIASGMARGGLKPFVYSGQIFSVMRPYEFLRDDVAYNNTNVKVIGTGASGFLGFTHNLEGKENMNDLLKNLPMKSFYPKNEKELKKAMNYKKGCFIKI